MGPKKPSPTATLREWRRQAEDEEGATQGRNLVKRRRVLPSPAHAYFECSGGGWGAP